MIINIVGGGPVQFFPDLKLYDDDVSIWIGVDKGVTILLNKGITPSYAFGDFDSVSGEEWQKIEQTVSGIQRFKPEKDETDMDLAINWALEQRPERIRIFGGTGGRLDHFFGNVQLLLKPILQKQTTEINIIDQQNIIYAKPHGVHTIEELAELKYISFIPITPVKNLSLRGFKYPLTDCHIPLGSTLCISNELLKDYGTFSFSEGILLVIRSCDLIIT
ncbi:thiamine diphosphokinase [Bacillus marasmi]|uniref:thiamine diphosphokinase n=1 Tax=Bacillus marasmi TaxID=1926279 RepID=UPI0011C77D4C|nr:thiamine diphosphokinase [Bacillus marasmi]